MKAHSTERKAFERCKIKIFRCFQDWKPRHLAAFRVRKCRLNWHKLRNVRKCHNSETNEIKYNFLPRDFMPMKRFSTMSILPTPWLPLWHRQTGALTLISPLKQPFHTETLHNCRKVHLPEKVKTKPMTQSSFHLILIWLAAFKLICEVVFNQSQRDSHPTSLRYEKISSGELLDMPSVMLVTWIGTPET